MNIRTADDAILIIESQFSDLQTLLPHRDSTFAHYSIKKRHSIYILRVYNVVVYSDLNIGSS